MTCAPLTPEQCSSMIMVMTSRRMWTMFQYVSLSASYVAPSTTWNMCSPRLQQQVRNSQLLRKCHNFSFFLLFLFVFGNIFYMIEIFRVIKSLLLCNSLVIFSFLFFIHFSLSISLRRRFNLHHTPHWHFFTDIIKWL
jgi:hypothetical protein